VYLLAAVHERLLSTESILFRVGLRASDPYVSTVNNGCHSPMAAASSESIAYKSALVVKAAKADTIDAVVKVVNVGEVDEVVRGCERL
jgi:tRNA splicing ligase